MLIMSNLIYVSLFLCTSLCFAVVDSVNNISFDYGDLKTFNNYTLTAFIDTNMPETWILATYVYIAQTVILELINIEWFIGKMLPDLILLDHLGLKFP